MQHHQTMPAFFIPHGAGPCFFMDWNPAHAWDAMADYLKGIASRLPYQPSAILMVSAHWVEQEFSVTSQARPQLYFDYYGFPPHTYELTYPASGQPGLAQSVLNLLMQQGIAGRADAQRDFDHGMFIPLKLMFPKADVPVVQLSLKQGMNADEHLQVGRALAALREQGVLIIGSGMSFHNMRGYGDAAYTLLSIAFDTWLTESVEAGPEQRWAALANWTAAPHARDCHPLGAEEHLLPLMVVAGAAGQALGCKEYSEIIMKTQLSAYRFG